MTFVSSSEALSRKLCSNEDKFIESLPLSQKKTKLKKYLIYHIMYIHSKMASILRLGSSEQLNELFVNKNTLAPDEG